MSIAVIGNGAIANLVCWLSHRNQLEYVNYVRERSVSHLVCQLLDGNEVVLDRKVINLADIHSKQINQQLIFLPLKAYQIIPALKQYSNYFANNSTIVLMHNGMVDLEEVKTLVPNNPIVAATISNSAFKSEVSKVNITGIGPTQAGWIRRISNPDLIEEKLGKLMSSVDWSNNIQQILWHKLAINAVINPLTAIHNINNGELNCAKYKDEVAAICNETAVMMNQLGFLTNADQLINKVMQVAKATAANFSSMHQDIAKGRRSEIDNINGYICAEAIRLGIPTPVHQELVTKITALEVRLTD